MNEMDDMMLHASSHDMEKRKGCMQMRKKASKRHGRERKGRETGSSEQLGRQAGMVV
jgi:hypothetical protein